MSPCHHVYWRCAGVALVLAIILTALPALLRAQTAPSPQTSLSSDETPKWEWFIGYQWLNPGGDVPVAASAPPTTVKVPSLAKGFGTSLSYNFSKYLALEVNYGGNSDSASYSVNTFSAGPKLTYRGDSVNFFGHALIGDERLHVPGFKPSDNVVAILGGGLDLKLWKPIWLRLFEADYQYSHQNFNGGYPSQGYNGALLRTGLVFNFGGAPPIPVAAACSIDRNEVLVGEPLHVTVAASNFNPKHTVTYAWTSTGGKIEGKDTGAMIDTAGAAPGNYTATATVTDPKAKTNNTAACSSNFTVKPLNPPQISCSASPSRLDIGGSATISCTCTSPDNATVTVGGWSSSGGSISGSGNSATLSTAGASAGPITVSATCTDSRGLTASTSASVTVNAPPPPPPPPPQASKVNECQYPNVKKPWRVDNTCKAELDDVALKLQQDPDAKLVVVGNADEKEIKHSKHKNLAGERAVDVKAYLSGGEAKQNIDPSRIECRTGSAGTMTTEQWIIPVGATFPEAGSTTPVDEKKVKPIPDHPKPAANKKAKKAQ